MNIDKYLEMTDKELLSLPIEEKIKLHQSITRAYE